MSTEYDDMINATKQQHLTMQVNGQRISGPCLSHDSSKPDHNCEVYISRIPFDMFEHDLLPLLETIGRVYSFRLMVNFSGFNRGFGYVQYYSVSDTARALNLLQSFEIRRNHRLNVCLSKNNCTLILGNISPHLLEHQAVRFICSFTNPSQITFFSHDNRKFATITFASHREAALSRRILMVNLNELGSKNIWLRWYNFANK